MVRKVAVIGAGASGLAAIKTCLEHDFDPICLEKSCDIGGWWNCQIMDVPSDRSHHPRALFSSISRSSKEFLAFSDFPPPKEYPTFLTPAKMMEYLRKYAQRYSLEAHIQFNNEVTGIRKADLYQENGRLIVEYRAKKSSRNCSETFDAVLVCTGHFVRPYIPETVGLHQFDGKSLHSSQYRNWRKFETQRVLVVGMDNYSVDICLDLSQYASQVYLSLNESPGKWLQSRLSSQGLPWDTQLLTKWNHFYLNCNSTQKYFQSKLEKEIKTRYDHSKFGMKPKHRLWQVEPPIISDEFVTCLHSGKIVLKMGVESFQDIPLPFVVFDDGSIETGINSVILNTGFSLDLGFMETLLSNYRGDQLPLLHNHIFPVELSHHTVSLIGLVHPVNGGDNTHVIAEIQARYVCQALMCKVNAPIRRKISICCASELKKHGSHLNLRKGICHELRNANASDLNNSFHS